MATHLSRHFKQRRLAKGLSLSQIARLCGYRNICKACNKIVRFEREGEIEGGLFRKLAFLLAIDENTITRLAAEDRTEYLSNWNRWADEPIEPYLTIRAIPGVIFAQGIPPELQTQEAMERYAAEIAQRHHKMVWLIMSRRLRILFDESAAARSVQHAGPGEPVNSPYMRLHGSKKRFLFTAEGGLGVTPLSQPPASDRRM